MIQELNSKVDTEVQSLNVRLDVVVQDVISAGEAMKQEIMETQLVFENVTVPTSSFVSDTTYEDYKYKVSIPLIGVTLNSILTVNLGMLDATSGVYSPIAESDEGIGYIYASEIPTEPLIIPTIVSIEGVKQ